MGIQEIDLRRSDFEAMHPVAKLFNFDHEKLTYFGDAYDDAKRLNDLWSTWCACVGLLYLETNTAKAQAVPEWISVEDRMPEYGVLVLIHNRFTFETMHTAKLIQLDGENYWFFESDDDYLHTRYTSHWMSIYKPQEPTHDQS